jgi:hypothetical protein
VRLYRRRAVPAVVARLNACQRDKVSPKQNSPARKPGQGAGPYGGFVLTGRAQAWPLPRARAVTALHPSRGGISMRSRRGRMYSGVPLLDPREPATRSWLLTSDTPDLSQASSLAARLARAEDTRARFHESEHHPDEAPSSSRRQKSPRSRTQPRCSGLRHGLLAQMGPPEIAISAVRRRTYGWGPLAPGWPPAGLRSCRGPARTDWDFWFSHALVGRLGVATVDISTARPYRTG